MWNANGFFFNLKFTIQSFLKSTEELLALPIIITEIIKFYLIAKLWRQEFVVSLCTITCGPLCILLVLSVSLQKSTDLPTNCRVFRFEANRICTCTNLLFHKYVFLLLKGGDLFLKFSMWNDIRDSFDKKERVTANRLISRGRYFAKALAVVQWCKQSWVLFALKLRRWILSCRV